MSGVTVPSPGKARPRRVAFRLSRIRWPEWLALVSAVVLLISLVGTSWFTLRRASGGAGLPDYVNISEDGWHALSHAHWLILITILCGLALFVLQAVRSSPALPVALGVAVTILGGASTIWLLVRVAIDPPGGHDFGGWLGLVSAAVLTWAGYSSMRLEGIAPQDGPREIPVVSLQELEDRRDSPSDQHS